MYINSVYIEKYKILQDLKIEFQIPQNNKNVVNVIAGVNGCGKTTLLEYLMIILISNRNLCFNDIFFYGDKEINGEIILNDNMSITKGSYSDYSDYMNKVIYENQYINGIHSSPRIIYISSNMFFHYESKSGINTEYEFGNIIEPRDLLGNAEAFIKNYIINKERQSREAEPIKRTIEAVDSFNSHFKDCDLVTKLIDLDIHNNNKPLFETINGDKVTIDKLSSGEQQLYARVVSLMILNPHNSIILIDEPEIALHPKWQIEIMKIYSSIGENNQFIVTTHSPFIISQTPHKNLIFLVKENEKIVTKYLKDSPLDRDINTIIKTLMGADYIPKELQELHNRYRELFNEGKIETDEAKELKKEILKYESENSSFFQSIAFDMELLS